MRSLSIVALNAEPGVYRVASVDALSAECEPQLRFLVLAADEEARAVVERWRARRAKLDSQITAWLPIAA